MMLIILGQLVSLGMGCLLLWGLLPWSLSKFNLSEEVVDASGIRGLNTGRLVLSLGVAMLAGVGLAGVSAWIHLILKLQYDMPLLAVDLLMLLLLAGGVFWYRTRRRERVGHPLCGVEVKPKRLHRRSASLGGLAGVLCWLLRVWGVIIAVVATLAACENLARRPWGDWDAVMIWNNRARFLQRAHELWPLGFTLPVIHPDYPILLPVSVYRLWQYAADEFALATHVVAMVFLLAAMLILWGTLRVCRGSVIAWIGLLVFVANPYFLDVASLQLADGPLGIFLMAGWAIIAVAAHQRAVMVDAGSSCGGSEGHRCTGWQCWVLAGMMFGCMAWIKNEGLLMLLATGAGVLMTRWPKAWLKQDWRLLAALVSGAIVFISMIIWAKLMLAGSNDLFRGQPGATTTIEKIMDPARHRMILDGFWQFFKLNDKQWPIVLLLVLLPVTGSRPGRWGGVLLGITATIVLTWAGYYLVYLTTPHDLQWHLTTSLKRLLMQFWPLLVLGLMLLLKLPDWGQPGKAPVA